MRTQSIFTLIVLTFLLSGCSVLSIGQSEFGCNIQEELSTAGICASPEFILKNKDNLNEMSYKGLVYKDGRFQKESK